MQPMAQKDGADQPLDVVSATRIAGCRVSRLARLSVLAALAIDRYLGG